MKEKAKTSDPETGPTTILGSRIRIDPPHISPPTRNVESPRPSVDDVAAWIRQEVARPQASLPASEREPAALTGSSFDANHLYFSPKQEAQWNRIRASLNLAEQNALAGTTVPELGRFRGVTRKLARLVARGLLYLARVVTNSQRKFNIATLASLRDLYHVFRQWEQTKHEQGEQDRQMLADLMVRCRKLEREVADLNARLDSDQPSPAQVNPA